MSAWGPHTHQGLFLWSRVFGGIPQLLLWASLIKVTERKAQGQVISAEPAFR